jgi:mono/diheme cytochrome c family protein
MLRAKQTALAGVVLLIAASLAAQTSRAVRTHDFLGLGPAPDPVAAGRGEKLYTPNCAFCHGARANGGDSGPDLIRSPLVLHDEQGELIGPVVHQGRPDRGMPAFASFTDAQLKDLAAFLHMKIEQAANRGLYQELNIVTGNPIAGAWYFRAHCSSCHSATGDLAHIAAKFDPPALQAQFLYPVVSAKTQVKVTLPTGETVTGTLKRLDDFNVSLYDANGDYHSWACGEVKVDVEDRLAEHRKLLDEYTDADMHNVLAYLVTLK